MHVYHREPPTGYSLPHDTGAIPYQNDKETDSEHLSDPFFYHEHGAYIFLFFSLFSIFFLRMLHGLLTMVMLQVSTMIRHGLG